MKDKNKNTDEPLTDEQIKAILRKEYPDLFPQDIDRIAKTCANEKWFLELQAARLSKDLKNGPKQVVVAANAGGVDKDDKPATAEEQYGETPEKYLDDPDPESLRPDRDPFVQVSEWLVKFIFSGRTDRARHMNASVGLALLKGEANLGVIAEHFGVTTERVTQVVKKANGFEISAR